MKKKEKKKITNTLYERLSVWLRKPENILFCIIMLAVTIVGIIDNNIEIIIIVYFFIFLYGLIWRLIFNIKDKVLSRKTTKKLRKDL